MRLKGFWTMNSFEAKYIKISSEYLNDAMQKVGIRQTTPQEKEEIRDEPKKKKSKLLNIVSKIFQPIKT